METELVRIEDVVRDFALPKTYLLRKAPVFRALHGINLTIDKGVSFGVVGESGCGKSTLARIVMALDQPTVGSVYFNGRDIFRMPAEELKTLRRHFQMVFQDPYGSLNPRQTVLKIVAEPLATLPERLSTAQQKERVAQALTEVGLNENDVGKYPHQFSGGQRQRIAIARALITRPSLIVADESVSALDVSVQAQVLNLMMDLQEKFNLAYMFISHDLSVVEYLTDQVAVIYLGRIVEQGKTADIFRDPRHPYTRKLLAAVPDITPRQRRTPPKPRIDEPEAVAAGCPFLPRCDRATDLCRRHPPELFSLGDRWVACHHLGP